MQALLKLLQRFFNAVFTGPPSFIQDVHLYVHSYDYGQTTGNISRINEMPLSNILEVEPINVWGVDFMRPLPSSFGIKYILRC